MNTETKTYQIDSSQFESVLDLAVKKRTIKSSLIFIGVCAEFFFLTQQIDRDFPSVIIILSIGIIGSFALGYAISDFKKTLKKFEHATYKLTRDKLEMTLNDEKRQIQFSEIATIDRQPFGTTVVKGKLLSKIDYYRPKNSGNRLDQKDVIFVPKSTNDYEELIEKIKTLANNG